MGRGRVSLLAEFGTVVTQNLLRFRNILNFSMAFTDIYQTASYKLWNLHRNTQMQKTRRVSHTELRVLTILSAVEAPVPCGRPCGPAGRAAAARRGLISRCGGAAPPPGARGTGAPSLVGRRARYIFPVSTSKVSTVWKRAARLSGSSRWIYTNSRLLKFFYFFFLSFPPFFEPGPAALGRKGCVRALGKATCHDGTGRTL
jgi:hypothetical protein